MRDCKRIEAKAMSIVNLSADMSITIHCKFLTHIRRNLIIRMKMRLLSVSLESIHEF